MHSSLACPILKSRPWKRRATFTSIADLKALYRWHNGMSTNSAPGFLPGQRFLPLDEFARRRTLLRQQFAAESAIQRLGILRLRRLPGGMGAGI